MNPSKERLHLSEAEHLLKGKWVGHGMQLIFEPGASIGTVSMSGMHSDQPAMIMDYTLSYLDGQLRIKIQSNAGERNYTVNQVSDQMLELSDAGNNTLSLNRAE